MRQQSNSRSVLGLRTWRKGALGVKLIQTQVVGRGMSSSRAPELVHVDMAKDAPAHPDCLSRDLQAQGKGSSGNVNSDFSAVMASAWRSRASPPSGRQNCACLLSACAS